MNVASGGNPTSKGNGLRLTVVGDLLLDRDLTGRVSRVCPDAPVPVVDVDGELVRPGGAGLAAQLAAADGADVTLVTAVDGGPGGRLAIDLLDAAGVRVVRGRRDAPIPEKARVRASGQSIARLDRGAGGPVENGPWPPEAAEAIRDAHAVLVSDYAGGVTASRPLREALASAAEGTAVVWDPHARGTEPVPGCVLVTPNRAEAGVVGWTPAMALRVARTLASRWRADAVCITLGADGAVLALPGGGVVAPAPAVAPTDVCGAGDRFASAATRSLAAGASTTEAVEAAVHAASAFVASGAPWTPATSATVSGLTATTDGSPAASQGAAPRRTPVVVCTSGCFDLLHAGHVRMLRSARALGDRLVVCLNDDDSVARLKGEGRPIVPAEERRELLLALDCVDDVVTFPEDTPERVLDRLRPDVFVKGADYRLEELPEARLVESWGGETVILPYEAGRSTTELIERSRSTAGTGAGAAGPRW